MYGPDLLDQVYGPDLLDQVCCRADRVQEENLSVQTVFSLVLFPRENIIWPEVSYFNKWHAKMLKQTEQLESNYFFTAASQPAVIIMFIM